MRGKLQEAIYKCFRVFASDSVWQHISFSVVLSARTRTPLLILISFLPVVFLPAKTELTFACGGGGGVLETRFPWSVSYSLHMTMCKVLEGINPRSKSKQQILP